MSISNTNKPASIRNQKILFCVLDWGIGHATRSAVLIKQLIGQDNQITLATNGNALLLLQKEFPHLPIINLPGYNIHYASKPFFALSMLLQIPKLMRAIRAEKKIIDGLDDQYDLIISDNRYGCYSSRIPSVFLSHQLNIQTPFLWLTRWANKLHHHFLAKYSELWIPDDNRHLSGALSELSWSKPIKRIGILSCFTPFPDTIKNIDTLIILSGPEPARTEFEKAILAYYRPANKKKIVLVGGKPTGHKTFNNNAIEYIPYCSVEALNALVAASYQVICRSGYSTIMDLFQADYHGQIMLIPTPGQTEQEYLAEYLASTYAHISAQSQASFLKSMK